MSSTGDNIEATVGLWNFSGDVVPNFDSHVSKSVPLYHEGHQLICDVSDFFINNDSIAIDIGCSTGSLLLQLAKHNIEKPGARFIGIDCEPDMIDFARQRINPAENLNISVQHGDIVETEFDDPLDLIVSYYTLQFIRPAFRQAVVDKIYQSLNWGGGFLLFEKVRAPDARFQDMLTSLYNDYKLNQGYTASDIITKSRSLKGVLEPFSNQANIDMLKRAGFSDIISIQKYICFEGFLAIK